MEATSSKFSTIESTLCDINCLLEMLQGYCDNASENIDEMNNLLLVIEILLAKHRYMKHLLEEVNQELLKTLL